MLEEPITGQEPETCFPPRQHPGIGERRPQENIAWATSWGSKDFSSEDKGLLLTSGLTSFSVNISNRGNVLYVGERNTTLSNLKKKKKINIILLNLRTISKYCIHLENQDLCSCFAHFTSLQGTSQTPGLHTVTPDCSPFPSLSISNVNVALPPSPQSLRSGLKLTLQIIYFFGLFLPGL